jgi:hypothetical protein
MVGARTWRGSSFIAWVISCFALVYVTFNQCKWRDRNILACDVAYYYLYLPSVFVYGDLGKMDFYPAKVKEYHINFEHPTYELYPQQTGRLTNKYAVGVAVCQMPFFLLAHAYCVTSGNYPADGFSIPFKFSMVIATLIWVIAGLFVLRKLLLLYYSENAAAVTLLLVAFATNLYFYTVDNVGMSHPFSFALCAFLCYGTARVYSEEKAKYFLLAAGALGMLAIVRPVNALMVLIPVLWPMQAAAGRRADFLKRNKWPVVAGAALCVAVCFLQFGYLKYTSGNWLHFSYQEEGFTFPYSEIWGGLFSYRKGWFVYTPLALLMMAGLVPMWIRNKPMSVLILLFLAVFWYVIFAWHEWWYGASFGSRPMVDIYALLALPLAELIQLILTRGRKLKAIAATLGVCLVVLNVFQSYQLMNEVTKWDNTTRAFYWRSFGRMNLTEADKKL